MRWPLVALLGLLAALSPATAAAAPRAVVIVVGRPADPYTLRLRAELESIGFEVEVVRERASVSRGSGALAVLTVDALRRVEVRLGSDLRGPPDAMVAPDGTSSAEVEAVQIAERVRTVLEPVLPAERATSSSAPTPEPVPVVAQPPAQPPKTTGVSEPSPPPLGVPPSLAFFAPTPLASFDPLQPSPVAPDLAREDPTSAAARVGFAAGAGALFAEQGSAIDLSLGGFYEPMAWLRFDVFVAAPLRPFRVVGTEGSASVHAGFVGAGTSLSTSFHPLFAGFLGLRVAGVWLRTEGEARAGYLGVTDDVFTAAGLFDAGVRVRLGESFALAPRATVGVAAPPVDVVFGGRDVSTWGLPLGSVSLNVEGGFPLGE